MKRIEKSTLAAALLAAEAHYLSVGEVVAANLPLAGDVPVQRLWKALGGKLFPARKGGEVFILPPRREVRRALKDARDRLLPLASGQPERAALIQAAARLDEALKGAAAAV